MWLRGWARESTESGREEAGKHADARSRRGGMGCGWVDDAVLVSSGIFIRGIWYQQSSGTSREGEGGARVRLGSSKPEYDQHRTLVLVVAGTGRGALPSERVKGRLGRLAGLQAASPPGGAHSVAPRPSYAKLEQRCSAGNLQGLSWPKDKPWGVPARSRRYCTSTRMGMGRGMGTSSLALAESRLTHCLILISGRRLTCILCLSCSASEPSNLASSFTQRVTDRSTPESDLASEHHDSTVA